ncbi:MAG: toxin regulator [Anaerobutyricum hallii]|uniref:toxin regulator n=1 Tax=Anaerobutyricum hallii TaxID=39488 RepID=UPI0024318A8F|nr:toxin regulator [Anaerobutyricum hallii]MDD6587636.1 toxin regulator [Anaerobutyricum hallii]
MNKKKGKKKGCLITLLIFVVLLGSCVAIFGDSDESSSTGSSATTAETTTEAAATEATTEATTEAATTEATTKAKKKTTKAKKKEKKKSYKKENWNPEITYDQLARTPDDYMGKDITFAGKVLQVMEDSSSKQTQLRIATSDDYDKVMLVGYDSSILKSRVLEDDEIRFYGTSIGLVTYQSTMGGNITIPAAIVEHIDIQ